MSARDALLFWIVGLAALTIPFAPLSARANPVDHFGLGARGVGMGGAFGALADDTSANYYNPAGLATGDDLLIELGYIYADPTLELNGRDLDVDAVHGLQGGLLLPGRVLDHRLALSVALYLPDERITRVRALPEQQPRFALYDNRPQRLVLTTSAAFEILQDVLYVGVGLTYLSNTSGRLNVEGHVDFADAGGTSLLSAVDVAFDAARYVSAGLLVHATDNLRLGLTFRDAFALTLDIGVVVNGDIVTDGATPDPNVLVEDARLEVVSFNRNLFSPRQLTLSAAWVEPAWTVAFDLTWQQWSAFPAPTAQIFIDLDAGALPLAIPKNPAPAEPGFHDVLIPRLGGEVLVYDGAHVGVAVRAGAWWEPSPAPDQPGRTNYVDADKVGASLGLGLRFSDLGAAFAKPFYLDLAGAYVHVVERTYTKDDPADVIGDYVATGRFLTFSATTRFHF